MSARGLVGPRSYGVKVGESTFVRNRRLLIWSDEQPMPSPLDVEDLPQPQNNTSEKAVLIPTLPSNGPTPNADFAESSSNPLVEPYLCYHLIAIISILLVAWYTHVFFCL